MYLTDKVDVVLNSSNMKHYSKFYSNLTIKDIIQVNIEELTKSNTSLIRVECDDCGKIKELKYQNYIKYGYNNGDYLCRSCKMKLNNLTKYGVENVFQLKSVKDKSKKTLKEKYDVDNISQLESIKKKKEETCLKNHGVKQILSSNIIKEKSKKTLKEKYGVDNISQLESIKKKKEETCLKNHGVTYYSKTNDFKEKIRNDNLEKYGIEHMFQSEEIKDKIKNTNLVKYGVNTPSKSKEIKDKISKSVLKTLHKKMFENKKLLEITKDEFILKCEICNKSYNINKILYYKRNETDTTLCTNCNPVNSYSISGKELKLSEFIKDNYNGKIIKNSRNIISPYELDIYIPDLNLAFEFNGVYWHNELYKSKDYHKMKTDLCLENNIELFHIWEDDWNYNKDLVKSMILNKLKRTQNKIFARKCKIQEINDISLIKDFLNKNHIQGFSSSKYKIGLFYDNELVSLMTFGKSRNNDMELLRFCNKQNFNIIGGASKLFKYFINKYNPTKIITYSDRCYSTGKLYDILNFKYIGESKPEYYYVINGIRKHKSNFKKSNLINQGYDKKLSEYQIMLSRNIYRIYNSGYLKYEWSIF
jgi:Ackermannviridae homing endonuclease